MSAAPVDSKSSARSVSARQLRANRRNAQKSTGPRTEEGKAASSRNAVTHGAFAADLLLPGEDAAELLKLRRGIYLSQSPQDAMERELVDRIVDAQWRLRRLRGAERTAILRSLPGGDPTAGRTPAQRMLDRAVRVAQKTETWKLFEKYGWDPEPAEEAIDAVVEESAGQMHPPMPPPGVALAQNFSWGGTGIVERLSRYQQRLEQSVHRALRELRQLRKDRRDFGKAPPCPYLAELEAEELETQQEPGGTGDVEDAEACQNVPPASNVQNEPISPEAGAAPGAAEGCERASREVVIVGPVPVNRAGPEPTRHEEKGGPPARQVVF